MSLQTSMQSLLTALGSWQQALEELQLTLGDRHEDLALVDALSTAVDDLLGWTHEARQSCAEAGRSPRPALTECGTALARAAQIQTAQLTTTVRVRELHELAQQRGHAWEQWSIPVLRSLEDLPPLMLGAFERLLECWRELQPRTPALN